MRAALGFGPDRARKRRASGISSQDRSTNISPAGRNGRRRVPAGDYRQSEWAGACYSPDGNWLFVNIQTPGVTFAITGPWGRRPL